MKIIKRLISIFLWILFLQCKKDSDSIKAPLFNYGEICDRGIGITVDTVFTNYIGTVKVADGGIKMITYIPTNKIVTGYLRPCNLPEQLIKDGQKVKISGEVLTYPGFEKLDNYAVSIHLTSVVPVNN